MPTINEGHGPLYFYDVSTVAQLLLCLQPHVLRAIRSNLVAIEDKFVGVERRWEVGNLIIQLDEMLTDLDGEA